MSRLSQFFSGGAPQFWVSGTTYQQSDVVRSPTDHQRYVRITNGAGTTDPASDTTNWRPDGGRAIRSIQRGVITITGGPGVQTATATISAVNTAKTELRFLGGLLGSGATDGSVTQGAYLALTNATTITANRYNGSPTTASHFVSWELTEFY